MPASNAQIDRARLAWRCRRGMKELDLLLTRWLSTHYAAANAAERAAFAELLELPDPTLAGCLLGDEPLPQARWSTVLSQIRAQPL